MVGYKSLGEYFKETDYDPHNSNNLIGFYSGTSAAFDGSWGTFNREHVWPDSRGGGRIDGDIHMTRPTLGYQNGSRGNSFYVEGKKTSDVGWDPAMETWGDEKYRGIAARIIFYGPVASDVLSLVDVEDDLESNNTMGKLSDLLRWNEAYPIDWSEIQRNEAANLIQGNRNPFIDHPEFANMVYDPTYDGPGALIEEGSPFISMTTKLTLMVNDKANLNAKLYNGLAPITFESDHPEIVKVDNNGNIEALAKGTATITAKATVDGVEVQNKCVVAVNVPIVLQEIVISGLNPKAPYGSNYDLEAIIVTANYNEGISKDVTKQAVIEGNINTKVLGNQTIKATFEGKTCEFVVKVTNVDSSSTIESPKEKYEVVFNSAVFTGLGSVDINGINWTLDGDGNYFSYNSSYGLHLGSGSKPFKNMTLSTKDFKNEITKVVINATGAASSNTTLSVSVGNATYTPEVVTLGQNSNKDFAFEGNNQGELKLTFVQTTSKAIYIKSISVYHGSGETIISYTPKQQASAYADYFINQTSKYCLGNNANHDAFIKIIEDGVWQDLKTEYEAMSNEAKQEFLNHEESNVAMAYERYSLIVNKYFEVDDFASLRTNIESNINNIIINNETMIFAVMLLAIIAVSGIVGVVLFNKKQKRQ